MDRDSGEGSPIALVDDDILALGFAMLGIEPHVIRGRKNLLKFLRDMGDSVPHVIFVNERVYEEIEPYRREILRMGLVKPVFAVVPDLEGPRGVRFRELRELLIRALGSESLKV